MARHRSVQGDIREKKEVRAFEEVQTLVWTGFKGIKCKPAKAYLFSSFKTTLEVERGEPGFFSLYLVTKY